MLIGAQGYTIRMYCQNERDIARSLKRVRDIGYTCIQVSGFGAVAPKKLREICDDNGLRIVLTHSPEARILHDTDALIEEHKLMGAKYVGIGMIPDRYRCPAWLPYFAEDFAPAAQKMADAGLYFMYHNHGFEFERLPDGRLMMDVLLSAMPKEIMGVTADTYWLQFGGMDVCAWLRRNAERLRCVHFKDMAIKGFEHRYAALGDGSLDFSAIKRTLEELGTTEYILVEQDDCYGENPFDCLARSYRHLQSL